MVYGENRFKKKRLICFQYLNFGRRSNSIEEKEKWGSCPVVVREKKFR